MQSIDHDLSYNLRQIDALHRRYQKSSPNYCKYASQIQQAYARLYQFLQQDPLPIRDIQIWLNLKVEIHHVPHQSIQECMNKIDRADAYSSLEKLVQQKIHQYRHDSMHAKNTICELEKALLRLEQAVAMTNLDDLSHTTYLETISIEEIAGYRLNHIEDMLVANMVFSKEVDERIIKIISPSIKLLLNKLSESRRVTYFFNAIHDTVMSELYRIQESIDHETSTPEIEAIRDYTKGIAEALNILYWAIKLRYFGIQNESLKFESVQGFDFSTISGLMNAEFYMVETELKKKTLSLSLERALKNNHPPILIKYYPKIAEITAEIYEKSVDIKNMVALHDKALTSITKTRTLCKLAEIGDLDGIKDLKPSAQDLNVMLTDEIQVTAMKAIYHFFSTLYHRTPRLFLGQYTPLMIAASYRHTEIVSYFLQQGADPNLKGGRLQDTTAYDCATLHASWLGFQEPSSTILELLNKSSNSTSNYQARSSV